MPVGRSRCSVAHVVSAARLALTLVVGIARGTGGARATRCRSAVYVGFEPIGDAVGAGNAARLSGRAYDVENGPSGAAGPIRGHAVFLDGTAPTAGHAVELRMAGALRIREGASQTEARARFIGAAAGVDTELVSPTVTGARSRP